MSGEPAKTRRLRTAEEWLMTALLRMVLAHCARPDGTLDSFAWAANAEAMRLLAARGLIRIDDDAGDRVRATVLSEGASVLDLAHARELIVRNREIMDGAPVFRGTRVAVHMIAELIAQAATPAELIESYPRLTPEMIRLAPVYAAAFPVRVRRRHNRPWRDRKPVHSARRHLTDGP